MRIDWIDLLKNSLVLLSLTVLLAKFELVTHKLLRRLGQQSIVVALNCHSLLRCFIQLGPLVFPHGLVSLQYRTVLYALQIIRFFGQVILQVAYFVLLAVQVFLSCVLSVRLRPIVTPIAFSEPRLPSGTAVEVTDHTLSYQ